MRRTLDDTGLPARYLELEVTEGTVMEDAEHIIQTMYQIKALGVRLSIDDFGTGYSNLGYLKTFPLDAIKIDKSFVKDIAGGEDHSGIASMIIALGHNLKLEVVAEGVEKPEQLHFLARVGGDMVQGYYVSRPLPSNQVDDFIGSCKLSLV